MAVRIQVASTAQGLQISLGTPEGGAIRGMLRLRDAWQLDAETPHGAFTRYCGGKSRPWHKALCAAIETMESAAVFSESIERRPHVAPILPAHAEPVQQIAAAPPLLLTARSPS